MTGSLVLPKERDSASTSVPNVRLFDSSADALRAVVEADWDFHRARTADGVHAIHPYPARFIPQIPRQLIGLLAPRDGSAILDPFCGSGTTLVEAQALGIPAVGVDLNPIATLIARVKTQDPGPLRSRAASVVRDALSRDPVIPAIPRLDHWFEKEVQIALARLVRVIDEEPDVALREGFQVALSSIIVRVSNQDGDTRYAAVKKRISDDLVYESFLRAAGIIDRAHRRRREDLFAIPLTPVRVITRDILSTEPEDIGASIGLVVTSPPYPNAYEYWLYHKYRMYWLGMDPIAVRRAEIGARPHFFRRNHQTEVDFEDQMRRCFGLLAKVMTRNGLACFLVGPSLIHGRLVDNAALLERAAAAHGLRNLVSLERRIPPTRKAFNPAHARINSESLMVFGR